MHVYSDTWSHQQFAGVLHFINEVDRIKETGNSGVFKGDLGKILGSWLAASMVPPLGHGRAQIFPDLPFLSWEYKNGKKKKIPRNNTEIFFEAANEMCTFMQKYREVPVKGLPAKDASEIKRLFTEIKDEDGDKRHKAWIDAI